MAKTEKLFYVAIRKGLSRAGEPAEIIGEDMIMFQGYHPRLCFKIRFNDGEEDFVPVFSSKDRTKQNPLYRLITEKDVREGRIPEAV